MIFNDEKIIKLLKDAPNGSELKVFFYIAANQPQDGIYGFRTTKFQLAGDLNLKRTAIFNAIKWLKYENLIQELKWLMTPILWLIFVMNNCDFETRKAEWARRCRRDMQRELRLREQKRRRNLKNPKK